MRFLLFLFLLAATPLMFGCGSPKSKDGDKPIASESKADDTLKSKDGKDASRMVVIAEGAGTTKEEALKDAFRQAVRQVVGTVVDNETLVNNDEVLTNKVLTHSDGLVKNYEEVSIKKENGLFRVKIKAAVEQQGVIAKLNAANVTVKAFDGKGLFTEVVNELEASKNITKTIAKVFEGFPVNYIIGEVVGKPEIVKTEKDQVTFKVRVIYSVDQKAYKNFISRLTKTLDDMGYEKQEKVVYYRKLDPSNFRDDLLPWASDYGTFYRCNDNGFNALKPSVLRNRVCLGVCTHVTKSNDQTEWALYFLEEQIRTALVRPFSGTEVKLSMLDADGGKVITDIFGGSVLLNNLSGQSYRFTPSYPTIRNHPYANGDFNYLSKQDWDNNIHFYVQPFFICHNGERWERFIQMTPKITSDIHFRLTLEELKSIHSIRCEILPVQLPQKFLQEMTQD